MMFYPPNIDAETGLMDSASLANARIYTNIGVALKNKDRVHKFQLAYLDDLRKIPDELFSLDKIQVLELRFLPKLEEIPSAIAKLRNLEQLYVNGTAIITIPKEISDLPRLI